MEMIAALLALHWVEKEPLEEEEEDFHLAAQPPDSYSPIIFMKVDNAAITTRELVKFDTELTLFGRPSFCCRLCPLQDCRSWLLL